MTRRRDSGVVLINVLVLLGLTASVVYLMLSLGDLSIARSQRFSEAGQALALIRGGERSAIAALRRDMLEGPGTDHAGESWSRIGHERIPIAGGSFELEVADAQGRFNLNSLAGGALWAAATLEAIVAELGLPPDVATRIAASVTLDGPLKDVAELTTRAGVAPGDIERLAGLVATLPGPADVNINAAPTELLAVLLQNRGQARVLAAKRERAGFLTPEDVEAEGLILPAGAGFASSFFRVRTTVRVGGTVQAMESLLQRRRGEGGAEEVAVVRRRSVTAAVPPPPPS